ncbi:MULTISPECIES: TetR/AcrR family transcriptional regulator [unclassified Cellulophaga]|uniref:TetR/AcrR family transcriptional regulator n=1 Tax=unclassified Cellulophaga TaxID=2634405 RepID=UPI0026E34BCD|nr:MULTISPECIES: TetR/AcrR family transcriptional regulator [unclassified Cellulophaga]MDO6493050.1 TetR/AcrR family transcriptional regulator [Cellulophaga sp. 2_MG-2023]MDO6496026.1 TetR/AcrR family transcriptional regulator [Cellulophaga sp. 3_MG-2023]
MQQELKSEITKQLIIDKAFNLFYRDGFKTTSIDKIMKETTLSKGAFYHHYKNKKELGTAVISLKVKKRVVDGMIAPLLNSGNAFEILETVFINRLKSFPFIDKQNGCPMNNLINEIGNTEIAYQQALKSIIEEWKTALVNVIERGKNEKSINTNIDSTAVAIYLISAFEGIRGIRKLYNDDAILNEYIKGLKLYLNQIKN